MGRKEGGDGGEGKEDGRDEGREGEEETRKEGRKGGRKEGGGLNNGRVGNGLEGVQGWKSPTVAQAQDKGLSMAWEGEWGKGAELTITGIFKAIKASQGLLEAFLYLWHIRECL